MQSKEKGTAQEKTKRKRCFLPVEKKNRKRRKLNCSELIFSQVNWVSIMTRAAFSFLQKAATRFCFVRSGFTSACVNCLPYCMVCWEHKWPKNIKWISCFLGLFVRAYNLLRGQSKCWHQSVLRRFLVCVRLVLFMLQWAIRSDVVI